MECKNNGLFNVSSFPDIFFELGEITFDLTYQDLFILDEKLNKYIFLILQEGYITNWNLGRIFFRKYQITFNEHLKAIGFYNSQNIKRKEEEGIIDKNKIIGWIVPFFQIIFIIGTILFLLYDIYNKWIVNKRKKRINELDDNLAEANLLEDKKI